MVQARRVDFYAGASMCISDRPEDTAENPSACSGFSQRTMTTMRRSGSTHVKELPAPTAK